MTIKLKGNPPARTTQKLDDIHSVFGHRFQAPRHWDIGVPPIWEAEVGVVAAEVVGAVALLRGKVVVEAGDGDAGMTVV
jgi:hypothetical protein